MIYPIYRFTTHMKLSNGDCITRQMDRIVRDEGNLDLYILNIEQAYKGELHCTELETTYKRMEYSHGC